MAQELDGTQEACATRGQVARVLVEHVVNVLDDTLALTAELSSGQRFHTENVLDCYHVVNALGRVGMLNETAELSWGGYAQDILGCLGKNYRMVRLQLDIYACSGTFHPMGKSFHLPSFCTLQCWLAG